MKKYITNMAVVFIVSYFGLSCSATGPSDDLTGDSTVTADGNSGPIGMLWVSINDPGVSGHDEPFNGQMSKCETTNAQYCQFLNAAKDSNQIMDCNNYIYASSDTSHLQPYYNLAGAGDTYNGATNGGASRIKWIDNSFTVDSGFENHPVTYVSWYGAVAFCNYYGYRLPTKWEWQTVANFDGSYIYGCGTIINNSIANYLGSTHPDGTMLVGALGTYGYGMADMTGNVSEWTSSISFYYGDSYRVICGSSWYKSGDISTVSYWRDIYPNCMSYSYGFRVCR